MEDCRVVELFACSEPAEFPGVLHECEVPPDKGKDAGCKLHHREGEKKVNQKLFTKRENKAREEERRYFPFRVGYSVTVLSRNTQGSQERGDEDIHKQKTLLVGGGRQTQITLTVDIYNNRQETWGRADYK